MFLKKLYEYDIARLIFFFFFKKNYYLFICFPFCFFFFFFLIKKKYSYKYHKELNDTVQVPRFNRNTDSLTLTKCKCINNVWFNIRIPISKSEALITILIFYKQKSNGGILRQQKQQQQQQLRWR